MKLSIIVLTSALALGPVALPGQETRSPDMKKQQHTENNPTPKVSPDSGSQLNQGDVPQEMPSQNGSSSAKGGSTKGKGRTKKHDTANK